MICVGDELVVIDTQCFLILCYWSAFLFQIRKSIMAEEFFYHYTSKIVAKSIIRRGKILPVSDSLEANGDALHGEGVYLTTLEPGHGEEIIKHNKWGGVAATKTTIEVFFEILIPSSKVVRANDTRDIQVHKGPLQLSNYKWSLKNWDGQLLATQFFMVSSDGEQRLITACAWEGTA